MGRRTAFFYGSFGNFFDLLDLGTNIIGLDMFRMLLFVIVTFFWHMCVRVLSIFELSEIISTIHTRKFLKIYFFPKVLNIFCGKFR